MRSVVVHKKNSDFYITQIDETVYPLVAMGTILASAEGFFWCEDTLKTSLRKRRILFRTSEISEIVYDDSLDSRFA